MKNEWKQDFTRRLSQCNSGQMIVIIYDIFFAYQEDAREAWNQKNHEEYKTAIRKAQSTLDELKHWTLNIRLQGIFISYTVTVKMSWQRHYMNFVWSV